MADKVICDACPDCRQSGRLVGTTMLLVSEIGMRTEEDNAIWSGEF